jgi:hypothetical protein
LIETFLLNLSRAAYTDTLPPFFGIHPPPDELLEQFLESFPEETAGVQLALMTATVKLFLKKPTEKPQQLIQLVLTYATQEVGRGCGHRGSRLWPAESAVRRWQPSCVSSIPWQPQVTYARLVS